MLPDAVRLAEAMAALGAVVLLILVVGRGARLLAAAQHADGQAPIRLRGTLALDTRRRLHLVEAEGRQALILTGGSQDLLLDWRRDGAAPEPDTS
jgi:flagellar biogenesis protein FliO